MNVVVKGGLDQLFQTIVVRQRPEVTSPRMMAQTNSSAGVIYLYRR